MISTVPSREVKSRWATSSAVCWDASIPSLSSCRDSCATQEIGCPGVGTGRAPSTAPTLEVDMSSRRTLKGRRIAVLAADGFEKVELTVPMRALRAAGAKVDVVSLKRGRIRGLNLNLPATRVRVDRTVEQAGAGD